MEVRIIAYILVQFPKLINRLIDKTILRDALRQNGQTMGMRASNMTQRQIPSSTFRNPQLTESKACFALRNLDFSHSKVFLLISIDETPATPVALPASCATMSPHAKNASTR